MMTENRKFILSKEPFIRKADHKESTSVLMRDFVIALVPLIIFAWVKNGLMPFLDGNTNFFGLLYPLLLVVVGGASSFLFEFLWFRFIVTNKPLKERMETSFALIPGLLLGMIVPLATPLWLVVFGAFFATVIGKLLFGGFGHNVFNPALVGYLFLGMAYPSVIYGANELISAQGFFNGSELINVVSNATPMTVFSADRVGAVNQLIGEYGLGKMLLGFTPGSLAETSALLCLISFGYLVLRKTIRWHIPVIYVGTVFVLTYIIGAINGYALTLDYALFGVLNGGLLFGAVFMATEPVTSPRNPNGKIIYALGLGVLTVLFRFASKAPEGVAVSILIMNMFTAIIEQLAARLRIEPKKQKVILTYALIGLLFSGISVYAVTNNLPKAEVEHTYTFVSAEQDFDSLNINYVIKVDDEEVHIVTNRSYRIRSIEEEDYNTDFHKDEFDRLIKRNKLSTYLENTTDTVDNLVLHLRALGFDGYFDVKITYDNNNVMIALDANTDNESYPGDDHPKDILPPQIILNQDDLDTVSPVSGATETSNAIINAARFGARYLAYLDEFTDVKLRGLSQRFDNFNFLYIFRSASGKIVVETDQEYALVDEDLEASLKTKVEDLISRNPSLNYIESVDTAIKTIKIITEGYASIITTEVVYDDNYQVVSFESDTEDETYSVAEELFDELENNIVTDWENLEGIQVIAHATYSSNHVLDAAKLARAYLKYLEENNE